MDDAKQLGAIFDDAKKRCAVVDSTKPLGTIVDAAKAGAFVPDDAEFSQRLSPTHWIDESIGRRYRRCTLDSYQCSSDAMRTAVDQCRRYVTDFGKHVRDGVSLVFIGPKGTGKDHLMVAAVRAICLGYPTRDGGGNRAIYRDGLRLFAEFRGTMRSGGKSEDEIVERYVSPHLLALSDPLPPSGTLSEYEQRMLLRIIDGRYRECRPMTATLNVDSRQELETRIGPQAADRLCDGAIIVKCNWESYRRAQK